MASAAITVVENPATIEGEYANLLAQADPTRNTVRKQRTCFLWRSQYFELDQFLDRIFQERVGRGEHIKRPALVVLLHAFQ